MASTAFKQDMPPEGGYRPLCFERIKPRRFFTVPRLIGLHIISTTYFYITYKQDCKRSHMLDLEDRSGMIALQPMLEAENDREYFRQLRKNRDDEIELMKNVPNWQVGKLYDEPIYKTVPEDQYLRPTMPEYYVHTRPKYFMDYAWFRHYR